jgi:hypothetical protein
MLSASTHEEATASLREELRASQAQVLSLQQAAHHAAQQTAQAAQQAAQQQAAHQAAQQRQAAQQHAAPPIYEVVNPQDVAAIHRLPKVTCPVLAADGSNFAEWLTKFEALCMVNRCWNMLTRQPASSTDDENMSVYVLLISHVHADLQPSVSEGDDRGNVSGLVAWRQLKVVFQPDSFGSRNTYSNNYRNFRYCPGEDAQTYARRFRQVVSDCKRANCGMTPATHIQQFLSSLPFDRYAPLVQTESARTDVTDWQQLVHPLVLYDDRMSQSSGLGNLNAAYASLQPSEQSAFMATHRVPPPAQPVFQQPTSHHIASAELGNLIAAFARLQPADQSAFAAMHRVPHARVPPSPQRFRQLPDPSKFCTYHQRSGHDTSECLDLQRQQARARLGNPAGAPGPSAHAAQTGAPSGAFLLDSGATQHMHGDRAAFELYMPITTRVMVTFGAGDRKPALGIGTICLRPAGGGKDVAIQNVLHVPGLVNPLMSVAQLLKLGCNIAFTPAQPASVSIAHHQLLQAEQRDSLFYVLADVCVGSAHRASHQCSDPLLWHRRFGHLSLGNLAALQRMQGVTGIDVTAAEFMRVQQMSLNCEPCILAKHRSRPFPPSRNAPKRVLERVSTDLSGPQPRALCGAQYLCTVTDHKSRYGVLHFLRSKSQAAAAVKASVLYLENQATPAAPARPLHVRFLRSDNGGEYLGETADGLQGLDGFLAERGIAHETTAPHTPQQNGQAERRNQTVMGAVRAMLLDSGLPNSLWVEAARYVQHLNNRSPVAGCTLTPHEALTGDKPDVSDLRVWGCTAYVMVPHAQQTKLGPRSRKGRFVGIQPHSKAYRVLINGSIVISTQVRFDENSPTPTPSTHSPPLQPLAGVSEEPLDGSSATAPAQQSAAPRAHELPAHQHVPAPAVLLQSAPEQRTRRASTPVQRYGQPLQQLPTIPEHAPAALPTDTPPVPEPLVSGSRLQPSTARSVPLLAPPVPLQSAPGQRAVARRTPTPVQRYGHAAIATARSVFRFPSVRNSRPALPSAVPSSTPLCLPASQPAAPLSPLPAAAAELRSHPRVPSASTPRAIRAAAAVSPRPAVPLSVAANGPDPFCPDPMGPAPANGRAPLTYREALASEAAPEYLHAMGKEYGSLIAYDVFTPAPLPPGEIAIGSTWVLTIKLTPQGEIDVYKARVVAKGFTQRPGLDYDETFAPVCTLTAVRVFLALVALFKLACQQLDVRTAFLNAALVEEVYMQPPPGFPCSNPAHVWRLNKALYGLRQASRAWYQTLKRALAAMGFVPSEADPSVFVRRSADGLTVQVFYVDDCLAAARGDAEITALFKDIADLFPVRLMGAPQVFLGYSIQRDREAGTLKIAQAAFTRNLLLRFGMDAAAPAPVPCPAGTKLVKEGELLGAGNRYCELVGCLIYLACGTRPDISYAVHSLTRFMHSPTEQHWKAAVHVLRYLVGTVSHGITYGGAGRPNAAAGLQVFCDADHAGDTTAYKSTTGYVCTLGGGAISWRSKLQTTAAYSTCEAEYQACATATKDVLFLRKLLPDMGLPVDTAVVIYNDNQGALSQIANPQSTDRSKHIGLVHHISRERQARGEVDFRYCSTHDNIADCLTKSLTGPALLRASAGMGVG